MPDHDRLSSLILAHWSRYRPSMLRQLEQDNRLQTALNETAERFTDLLYELTSVRKIDYTRAWEMTIDEILLPEESSSTNQINPLATSG